MKSSKRIEVWTCGLLIELVKKGNLSECNNWRGMTLLSVTGKVFTPMFLCKIKEIIDILLRRTCVILPWEKLHKPDHQNHTGGLRMVGAPDSQLRRLSKGFQ